MRRLSRRRVLCALYVASLLGCVAAAGLWLRGAAFHYVDGGAVTAGGRGALVYSFGNTVTFTCSVTVSMLAGKLS